jgi:hypothetical protein
LLVAALSAAGLAVAVPAFAAGGHGGGGGHSGGGGGHWGGGGGHSGGGHWSGGGHYGGGHYGGGHYYGGHYSHWYGPSWGFYWGVPLAVGAWWWGYPYYYGYPYGYAYSYPYYDGYYAAPAPSGEAYPQGNLGPPAQAQPGPGAPSQGPLYMNYCESSQAYYPKVTQCPEGWKFIAPAAGPRS